MRSRKLLKLLSMMLVLAMVIGMVPKAAKADGVLITEGESGTLINVKDVSSNNTYLVSVKINNGTWDYDFENDIYYINVPSNYDITQPLIMEITAAFTKTNRSGYKFFVQSGETKYISAKTPYASKKHVYKWINEPTEKPYVYSYNTQTSDETPLNIIPSWSGNKAALTVGVFKDTTEKAIDIILVKESTGDEPINSAPTFIAGISPNASVALSKNDKCTLDLLTIFSDADEEDVLKFQVSITPKGSTELGAYEDIEGNLYEDTFRNVGYYTLTFRAHDGKDYSLIPYTINLHVTNNKPRINNVSDNPAEKSVFVNEVVEIDLTNVFWDPNGDSMRYRVKVDGTGTWQDVSGNKYTCIFGEPMDHTIEFQAYDDDESTGWSDTYIVTVIVNEVIVPDEPDSETKYDFTVNVPTGFTPDFYITSSANFDSEDVYRDQLDAESGATTGGFTTWTVKVPENISRISYRAVDTEGNSWGGMSFATKTTEGAVVAPVTLRPMKGVIKTLIGEQTPDPQLAEFKVRSNEGNWAVSGGYEVDAYNYLNYRFLLVAYGNEATYTYYSVPTGDLTDTYGESWATLNPIMPESAETEVYPLPFSVKSGFTITAPKDADVKMFNQGNYYRSAEVSPIETEESGDMVVYTYQKVNNGSNMSYRVSMEGKVTKVGYVNGVGVTITWSETDDTPNTRKEYDLSSTYGQRAEDSVLLNVNSQNNLILAVNETFTLRPFRIWEIVNSEVDNMIIEPDFIYNVLTGEKIVSVTPVDGHNMNAGNNRLELKAEKPGIAIIEVGYDALNFAVGDEYVYHGPYWDKTFQGKMTYNAADPARTSLVVVQVGGAAEDVKFGILSKINQNKTAREWDAEHDTVYFLEEKGQISFSPSVTSGSITEVAVSNDKGATWNVLTAEGGVYTADIVSGNNIIRVKKDDNTEAYQVVRGDKLTAKFIDGDRDGVIEAGEKVTVSLSGLHAPNGKMSGIYNPGGVTTSYTFNGTTISKQNTQYISTWTDLEITVPEDAVSGAAITLTNGATGVSWMGQLLGKHRDITDAGMDTSTSALGQSAVFNILPDITFMVGQASDAPAEPEKENTAPVLAEGVTAVGNSAAINTNEVYRMNLATIFADAEGDALTYKVSVNGGNAETVSAEYGFVPPQAGTYNLVFTANDGKLDSTETYTIMITVTDAGGSGSGTTELDFGLSESEIVGYVTISFEDYAQRLAEELPRIEAKYQRPLGTIVAPVRVPFAAYDTVATVTIRLLQALNMTYEHTGTLYSGFYLAAIGDFVVNNVYYDMLAEKQVGSGSGWMITLNKGGTGENWFIDKGASAFVVTDGDIIKWQYTCQLGSDIGDDRFTEEETEEETEDTTTSTDETTGEVSTTTKTEVTVTDNTASTTITQDSLTETIQQAIENKADEIVFVVSVAKDDKDDKNDTQEVEVVNVQFETATVTDVLDKTEAVLTVKTEKATVSLDRETLKVVGDQAKGEKVELNISEVAQPTKSQKKAAGENAHFLQLEIKSGDKTISKFKEGKVTVTVPVPEHLDGKKLAAVHIGNDGKLEKLNGEEITVDGQKHYRFHTPHFSTFALVDTDEVDVYDLTVKEVTKLLKKLTPTVTSTKTSAKNVKVKGNFDAEEKEILQQIEDAGYTVKYNFFRSTNKYEGYKTRKVKDTLTYAQKNGEKGTYYYYKVRVEVYDADGNRVAVTKLNQCKNHKVKWTKK